jgi:hypothetical protein
MAEQNVFDHLSGTSAPSSDQSVPSRSRLGGVVVRAKPEKPREAPTGYRYNAAGNVEFIPGGPADPEVKQDTKPSEAQNKIFQLLTRISGGANDIQNALAIDSEAQQGGFFETISRSTLGEGMITRGISGENRRIVTDSQANILDALLTLGTGAAYNEEQKVANSVAYFPQYGDSDREIIIKNERLNQAIAAARIAAGPLAEDFDKSIQPLMNTIDGNVEKPPSEQLSADIRVAEGKTYSTDEDFKRRRDSAEQWSATQGLPFDQALVKFNAAMQAKGYGEAGADTIEALRRYEETGDRGAAQWSLPTTGTREEGGQFSPVGEAVAGYTVGAANALTAGMLDELAPILGLEPDRVQAAKVYLRERAPVSSFAGEVTGGVLASIPAVRGAGLALGGTRLAGAAPLIGEIAYGAGYGAGELNEDRLTGALIGAGAAGAGGALANRFLPGGPGTFSGMTPDVPPVAAMAPEVAPAGETYTVFRGISPKGPNDFGVAGKGEYTSGRRRVAEAYAKGGSVEERTVTLQNPLKMDYDELNALQTKLYGKPLTGFEKDLSENFDQWLRSNGYDGVVLFDKEISTTIPEEVVKLSGQNGAAAPAPSVAAPGALMATEEMITLAQNAVSRTPGASQARAQLAEIAKANPEAKAAADRLGLELPTDTLSDNAQLKEVVGLTRSQIGSEAKQAWNETVQAASDRAHTAMDELDAVTDISQVSADVFDRLDKAQMGLGRQASDLRQEVTDAVDVRGRVDATGIKSWLQTRIDDLGGGKEGIAALSSEEKRLWGIVSKGQPTYALLNEQRDLIGQALEKGTGPWANTNMKRLKDIYGSLAGDQINFIEASAGKEIADKQRAANTLFKQMYDGREQMQKIFAKDLSGSLAPIMQRAITQGTKGNVQTLNTLIKIIPEDMRGKVLTSALFKAAKTTDETFSFTNFANIYRDLRSNSAVYKQFAQAVGPEGDKLLTDLYAISRRLSDADKAISRTGASTQLQLLNSERLLSRILMASGGAAGAGAVASVLGGPGAAVVAASLAAAAPEIAQRVGKTNAQKLHNLMGSAEFRDLATSAATGDALDRNINRVAGSKQFRDYAKAVGIELKQGRNWLRSAITVGPVGEFGPDGGPPEGAIMVPTS